MSNNRQLNRIIKDIDKLYDSNIHAIIKKATPNDKKYLVAIMTSQQQGGSSTQQALMDLSLITSGNREIKQIVMSLKSTIQNLVNELDLSKQENKFLKDQIRNLDKGVSKLDKTKCKQKMKQAQEYIQQFLEVRKAMINLVSFIKKKVVTNSTKLKFLSKPPQYYENKLEELQKIQIKKPTCENVQGILEELEEYQNPDILNRIVNDFENLSGTVRVFVRIFNESFVNPNKRIPPQTFQYKIVKDNNNIKKVKEDISNQCELPPEYANIPSSTQCLTPSSIIKEGKEVVRSKYPCMDSNDYVPFRYRYGPFFDVFQNVNNNKVFQSFSSIIKSLERGNQVIVFGYGYSGSGKTYSLLGDQNEAGILQMILKHINVNTSKLSLRVKELYGRIEPPSEIGRNRYENNIDSKLNSYGNLDITSQGIEAIIPFIKDITKQRQEKQIIKFTSNNANSSRAHLFFQISITFNNGISTKLMLIDLAGAEDPFIIGQTFLKIDPLALKSLSKNDVKMLLTDITNPSLKIRTTFWEPKVLKDFSQKTNTNLDLLPQEKRFDKIKIKISQNDNSKINNIMNRLFLFYFKNHLFGKEIFKNLFTPFRIDRMVNYIWDMLTEGFFINESLNHLKIFLQR